MAYKTEELIPISLRVYALLDLEIEYTHIEFFDVCRASIGKAGDYTASVLPIVDFCVKVGVINEYHRKALNGLNGKCFTGSFVKRA